MHAAMPRSGFTDQSISANRRTMRDQSPRAAAPAIGARCTGDGSERAGWALPWTRPGRHAAAYTSPDGHVYSPRFATAHSLEETCVNR